MKILYDITDVNSSSATTEALPIENATDIQNFKEWRSTNLIQQTITLNFTGSIDTIAIFGANFSAITIDGTPKTLVKDNLIGDYRGYFTVSATSTIDLIVTVQTPDDSYYKISAIAIGNENDLNNVVYPFNEQLVNPAYKSKNESGIESKTSKGHNYRLIEIQRQHLDYSGIGDLSEIKKQIKKSQTLVLFVDDSNVGECYLGTRVEPFEYSEISIDGGDDSLILEETGGKPVNIRTLVEIELSSETLYYALESLRFPVSAPVQYKRMVEQVGAVKDTLQDSYNQFKSLFTSNIILDNKNDTIRNINSNENLRGKTLLIKNVDLDTDSVLDTYNFTIEKPSFTQTQARIDIERAELDVWHIKHPKEKFNLTNYPDIPDGSRALDVRIPYYYGINYAVPCYYTKKDTDLDEYTYTIANHGIEEITTVYRDGVTVSPSEYLLYPDTDGSAYIVFDLEQKAFSGNLHYITADIKGMKPSGTFSENPVTCFQHWLETYVGVVVNASSFSTAETEANNLSLKIGGSISESADAIDWQKEWLMACRGAELYNGDSGWEITIPTYQALNDAEFTEDNIQVKSMSESKASTFVNDIDVQYYFGHVEKNYLKNITQSCGKGFGTSKEYKLKLVNDDDTASRIAQYFKNIFLYGDVSLEGVSGLDASELKEGEIVSVTHSKPYLDNERFKVRSVSRKKNITELSLRSYSSDIFEWDGDDYEGTPPSESPLSAPDDVTSLAITASKEVQNDGTVRSIFTVTFTPPGGNFSHAIMYLKEDGGTYAEVGNCQDGRIVITSLTAGLEYYVKAVSTNGQLFSNGVETAKTLAVGDSSAPDTPTSFTATDKMGQVELDWIDNTEDDFDHYNVYRASSKIAETRSSIFNDNPPAYNTNYSYQISAVDKSGNESILTSSDSAKKLFVNGDDINISSGTIEMAVGADILFTGCCTFDATSDSMFIYPTTDAVKSLLFGSDSERWEEIIAHTELSIDFTAHDDISLTADNEINLNSLGFTFLRAETLCLVRARNDVLTLRSGGDTEIDGCDIVLQVQDDDAGGSAGDNGIHAYLPDLTTGKTKTKRRLYLDASGFVKGV